MPEAKTFRQLKEEAQAAIRAMASGLPKDLVDRALAVASVRDATLAFNAFRKDGYCILRGTAFGVEPEPEPETNEQGTP
jgi:hypothetical protein